MSTETGPLPWFNRPPVQEVALSVQFQEPLDLEVTDLGAVRAHFRSDYPNLETHPPLAPMRIPQQGPGLVVRLGNEFVATPRLWFLNEGGNRLVQLQSDRLSVNWRRRLDETYPRYDDAVRPMMESALGALSDAMRDLGKSLPKPEIGEVLYVNPIEAGEGFATAGEIGEVIALWGSPTDGFLPVPSEARLAATYPILDNAFLNVEVTPAQNASTGTPVLMTKLLARGLIQPQTIAGTFSFFDMARDWIVRGFTSATTSKMHRIWERADAK